MSLSRIELLAGDSSLMIDVRTKPTSLLRRMLCEWRTFALLEHRRWRDRTLTNARCRLRLKQRVLHAWKCMGRVILFSRRVCEAGHASQLQVTLSHWKTSLSVFRSTRSLEVSVRVRALRTVYSVWIISSRSCVHEDNIRHRSLIMQWFRSRMKWKSNQQSFIAQLHMHQLLSFFHSWQMLNRCIQLHHIHLTQRTLSALQTTLTDANKKYVDCSRIYLLRLLTGWASLVTRSVWSKEGEEVLRELVDRNCVRRVFDTFHTIIHSFVKFRRKWRKIHGFFALKQFVRDQYRLNRCFHFCARRVKRMRMVMAFHAFRGLAGAITFRNRIRAHDAIHEWKRNVDQSKAMTVNIIAADHLRRSNLLLQSLTGWKRYTLRSQFTAVVLARGVAQKHILRKCMQKWISC
jgi:hypothetical protein